MPIYIGHDERGGGGEGYNMSFMIREQLSCVIKPSLSPVSVLFLHLDYKLEKKSVFEFLNATSSLNAFNAV